MSTLRPMYATPGEAGPSPDAKAGAFGRSLSLEKWVLNPPGVRDHPLTGKTVAPPIKTFPNPTTSYIVTAQMDGGDERMALEIPFSQPAGDERGGTNRGGRARRPPILPRSETEPDLLDTRPPRSLYQTHAHPPFSLTARDRESEGGWVLKRPHGPSAPNPAVASAMNRAAGPWAPAEPCASRTVGKRRYFAYTSDAPFVQKTC